MSLPDEPPARVRAAGAAAGVAGRDTAISRMRQRVAELRDGDAGRYGGKGVLRAVEHVNTELADAVRGPPLGGLEEQAALAGGLLALAGPPTKTRRPAGTPFPETTDATVVQMSKGLRE